MSASGSDGPEREAPPAVLPGWCLEHEEDTTEIRVLAPGGHERARLVDDGWAMRGAGLLRRVPRLRATLDQGVRDSWRRSKGRVPRGGRVEVTLKDGSTTRLVNSPVLSSRSPRFATFAARRMTFGIFDVSSVVELELRGRRYRYWHVSEDAAVVHRDGAPLAYASGSKWHPQLGRLAAAGFAPWTYVALSGVTDDTDDLAVVILVGALGRPGRPGALRNLAEFTLNGFTP